MAAEQAMPTTTLRQITVIRVLGESRERLGRALFPCKHFHICTALYPRPDDFAGISSVLGNIYIIRKETTNLFIRSST